MSDEGAPEEVAVEEVVPKEIALEEGAPEDVTPIEIQEEMEGSFLEYAMSVIISRALPDARDGLKPVHRRILWSMFDQGFRPDKTHVKCARVSGDVMARFHPHGDSAIYEALVRMAQPFSLRHPLIDFHGNYGSTEDRPAAARYTESRLHDLAMHMLAGINEETVDFVDNYSGDFVEPSVLPSRFPNLLVNGSQGIAVGMATNIPPHNLNEICDAVVHLLRNPDATIDDLLGIVKGPDFPTGGQILGYSGIDEAYRTGRGSIKTRAIIETKELAGRQALVVTAFPYQVSAEQVASKIANLVANDEIDGISDINDESSGDETRFVVSLKRDANAEVVLNNLWKRTTLQTNFSVNMVALVGGVPRTLNLLDALRAYVDHQVEVVRRRSEYRLDAAEKRLHIVEGLLRCVGLIDAIIKTIRGSEKRAAAQIALMAEPFEFSEIQAKHILEMQLARLTKLGETELKDEKDKLEADIAELRAILADEGVLREVIVEELLAIRNKFGEERRTTLEIDPGELNIEDLIDDDPLVVTLSADGYMKAVSAEEFKLQGRGGRGITGTKLREDDSLTHMIWTTAHSHLLLFSNRGKVYKLRTHEISVASRSARGSAIVNWLALQEGEVIQTIIDTRNYETDRYMFFATAKGTVKRTLSKAFNLARNKSLIAIRLNEGDELIAVVPTNGANEILLSTKFGQTIRFEESDVSSMGRAAAGVRGIRLTGKDEVVACNVADDGASLLHITSGGFGKRTSVGEYGVQRRGGKGKIGIRLTSAKGNVVGALVVDEGEEIMAATENGIMIRTSVEQISTQGRYASGVRVMTPDEGDRVASIVLVKEDEEADSLAEAEGLAETDRLEEDDSLEEAEAE